jgi:tetratricopeptide (TPR) repeat protein
VDPTGGRKVEVPAALIDRLKGRQVVLVAGLRASELAGAPAWEELGRRLVDWLEDEAARAPLLEKLGAPGALAGAVALLGARVPRDALVEVVKDAYPRVSAAPAAVAAVARIPWRGTISTGFDELWALPDGGATRLSPAAAELASFGGRFSLDLCGTTASPDGLCVGAAEQRARLAPTGVLTSLRVLARKRSFVLVGFAPGDPDLELLARVLAEAPGGGPHFLFTAAEGLDAELLGAELGATVVSCEAGRAGLEAALGALAEAWESVASEARPADDDVGAWLELARRDPADEAPRAALARREAALREEKKWDDLVELLLQRLELTDEPGPAVELLREVARLYAEKLEAPDQAFTALEAALRRDPTSDVVRVEVERAAGRAALWGELAADYGELAAEAAASRGAAAAVSFRRALARVYAEELEQHADAVGEYEAVLAAEPKDLPAATAVVELLTRLERWSDLAPALERALALEGDAGRARELRLQLADLQAQRLGDAAAALATYEGAIDGALGDDARSGEALDAMEKVARRAERWSEVARVLGEKIRRAPDAASAARLRRERAAVLDARLDDAAGALAELEAALAADGDDRAALRAAEKLYERLGRDDDYLRTVERLADLAESDAERLLLLRRLAAEWEERRGKTPDEDTAGPGRTGLDRAADALEQILQIAPDDVDAFHALSRVYRQARRHLALAEAIERRRQASPDRAERRALTAELARLTDEDLAEPARAVDLYAEAEELGDESEATLGALARLHDKAGKWAHAAEAYEKLARSARELPARVDALVRSAALAGDKLGDRAAAEARYARALELDAGNLPALGALAALYRGQGDHLRAAKLMREAEAHTTNRLDKARLLHDLGVLYQDELHDDAQAAEVLARVLEVDPEHVPAAERLADLYERAGKWAPLEPVLELLARKGGGGRVEPAALARLHARLGAATRRLGNLDKSARAYEAALELAPDSYDVLRAFGELREARTEWREAAALYAHAEEVAGDLAPAARAQLLTRLGRAQAEAGARAAALEAYGRALALEPANRAATEAVAALHGDEGDYGALVEAKKKLLALAQGDNADDVRSRLFEEIGDLYADKLGDAVEAISAYRAALGLGPARRQTLHKLLELHTAAKEWTDAAATLERLADGEASTAVRAKYLYAAAVIRRDELEDLPGAVALLNRALDDAPDLTKAFDAIERILSEIGAWKELARNYRRMIKRLPAEGLSDLRLRLWSGLGDVSLTELEDPEMAATALEVAASLDPDNVERHERLADVYVAAGPSHHDKAIAEHQWLVARSPERLASYRALASLYAAVGAHDKLWCVAATLSFLRKADAELEQFYEAHRPRELRAASRPLDDEAWLKVLHPAEDRFIDAVFMLLGGYVASATAQQHPNLGLRRKDRVDVATDQRVPTRALRYVAETLEVGTPDLFFKESEPRSLSLVNLQEKGALTPAIVIGKGIEQRASEAELVFEMGRSLAFLRPERFVRAAVPSAPALEVALRAALALAGLGGGASADVERFATDLARVVPKPVVDQLAGVTRKLVAARGDALDVPAWMVAADLTAARAGFALTSDLSAAARVISSEPSGGGSGATTKQRLEDLLAYSVSEDYFAVRRALGFEIA